MSLFRAEHIALSYRRGGEAVPLLRDASFSLEAGAICDLVGPSGAGKSTLLRACSLMLGRDSGELYLDGRPSSAFKPTEWRRQVCLVPQQASLVAGTVRDNLVLPWKLKVNAEMSSPSDDELACLLEAADLSEVGLARDVSRLSGGQAARVALLRAFATRPHVLLLDEVDAALDDDSALAVGRLTRSLVDERTACLRIRHRASDGFASGTFTLADGALSFAPASAEAGEGMRP